MAENTVDIKLRADAGDATKNLGAFVAELDALAGKLGGELGTQATEAAQRLRELGEQRAAIEAFQQISAQAAQTQSALRGLSIEADRYQEQITRAGPPTAQEVEQLNRLRAAADAAKIKMEEQQAAVSQAAAAMQRHGVSVAGAGQAMTRIEAETRRTVEGMTALHAQTAAAVKPLSDAGGTAERTAQSVSALGDAAHRMAAQMATAFTFRELVQAAAQMEQVSAGLKAVFGSAEQAAQGSRLALHKDAIDAMNDARGAVLGRMRQAVMALVNSGDDRQAHDMFLAGLVGQVQAELTALREEFSLPDVSSAAEQQLAAEVAEWSKA